MEEHELMVDKLCCGKVHSPYVLSSKMHANTGLSFQQQSKLTYNAFLNFVAKVNRNAILLVRKKFVHPYMLATMLKLDSDPNQPNIIEKNNKLVQFGLKL